MGASHPLPLTGGRRRGRSATSGLVNGIDDFVHATRGVKTRFHPPPPRLAQRLFVADHGR